jgi:hypothetical protein
MDQACRDGALTGAVSVANAGDLAQSKSGTNAAIIADRGQRSSRSPLPAAGDVLHWL